MLNGGSDGCGYCAPNVYHYIPKGLRRWSRNCMCAYVELGTTRNTTGIRSVLYILIFIHRHKSTEHNII